MKCFPYLLMASRLRRVNERDGGTADGGGGQRERGVGRKEKYVKKALVKRIFLRPTHQVFIHFQVSIERGDAITNSILQIQRERGKKLPFAKLRPIYFETRNCSKNSKSFSIRGSLMESRKKMMNGI